MMGSLAAPSDWLAAGAWVREERGRRGASGLQAGDGGLAGRSRRPAAGWRGNGASSSRRQPASNSRAGRPVGRSPSRSGDLSRFLSEFLSKFLSEFLSGALSGPRSGRGRAAAEWLRTGRISGRSSAPLPARSASCPWRCCAGARWAAGAGAAAERTKSPAPWEVTPSLAEVRPGTGASGGGGLGAGTSTRMLTRLSSPSPLCSATVYFSSRRVSPSASQARMAASAALPPSNFCSRIACSDTLTRARWGFKSAHPMAAVGQLLASENLLIASCCTMVKMLLTRM